MSGKRKREEKVEEKNPRNTRGEDFPPRCWNQPPLKKQQAKSAPEGALGLIHFDEKKWLSDEVLRYYFLPRPLFPFVRRADWIDSEANKNLIREAFNDWNEIVGVRFEETTEESKARIKIGFLKDDGSWSFVGTDILLHGPRDTYRRTMNFGWNLFDDWRGKGVAIHEIGHTLDFPHEHQNPKAGFKWDIEATVKYYQERTNPMWTRDMILHNVTNPLTGVTSSDFDPISIMAYGVSPGLILEPEKYFREGLEPTATLSEVDRKYASLWYPKRTDSKLANLEEGKLAKLPSAAPHQTDFNFTPVEDGSYTFHIVGPALDAKILLIEGDETLKARYTGGEKAPTLSWNLQRKKNYSVRIRINTLPNDKTAVYAVAYRDTA